MRYTHIYILIFLDCIYIYINDIECLYQGYEFCFSVIQMSLVYEFHWNSFCRTHCSGALHDLHFLKVLVMNEDNDEYFFPHTFLKEVNDCNLI